MKKFFVIFFAIILIVAGYLYFTYFKGGKKNPKGPRPAPMAVSKHSEAFNSSFKNVLDNYYALSEAFVKWDPEAVAQAGTMLGTALDSFRIDELKVDTTKIYETALDPLNNIRNETATILSAAEWEPRRRAFQNLSDNLRLLTIVARYDQEKMYWQECPMAFNETETAYWLSPSPEVRNPYLGTKHPVYKGTMLTCGSTKDTINFMEAAR